MILPFLILNYFNHPGDEEYYWAEETKKNGSYKTFKYLHKYVGGRYGYLRIGEYKSAGVKFYDPNSVYSQGYAPYFNKKSIILKKKEDCNNQYSIFRKKS